MVFVGGKSLRQGFWWEMISKRLRPLGMKWWCFEDVGNCNFEVIQGRELPQFVVKVIKHTLCCLRNLHINCYEASSVLSLWKLFWSRRDPLLKLDTLYVMEIYGKGITADALFVYTINASVFYMKWRGEELSGNLQIHTLFKNLMLWNVILDLLCSVLLTWLTISLIFFGIFLMFTL